MSFCLQRREFIAGLGGAAVWPLATRAQRPAMPVVGFIDASSAQATANGIATFRKGLEEVGFVQGRNVAIEFRHADNKIERLPELAADLVRRRVAVFAAFNLTAALAARAADPTIPMVFHTGGDPVQTGLVASLDRPGGNITAVNSMNNGLLAKRLGLLHEMVPRAKRFAVLVSPVAARDPGPIDELLAGASVLGLQVDVFTVSNGHDIDLAFASLDQKPVDALIFNSGPLFRDRRVQIVTLAAHHRLPASYAYHADAAAGGLMSYGALPSDSVIRVMGNYVGRILKGENAGDLPVQRTTKFEFVINLQTARTLGIDVPPTLLAIADEVIE
jgi:putative ABC transport system substrate-binding protein